MTRNSSFRRTLLGCLLIAIFSAGVLIGQNKFGTPKTVIHVVTVKWKDDSTPEQRKKALDGVKAMAATIPGIKNVWLEKLKVQAQTAANKPYDWAFVMEFESEAALTAYADHPKHKEWDESLYFPVREERRTHDISN